MIKDLEDLKKLIQMCEASGVTQMRVGEVEFSMRPKLVDVPDILKDQTKVTDQDILFNPYHGME